MASASTVVVGVDEAPGVRFEACEPLDSDVRSSPVYAGPRDPRIGSRCRGAIPIALPFVRREIDHGDREIVRELQLSVL